MTDDQSFELKHESRAYRAAVTEFLELPDEGAGRVRRKYWKVEAGPDVICTLPLEDYPSADAARRGLLAFLTQPTFLVTGGPANGQTVNANMSRILLEQFRDGGHYERIGDTIQWFPG
jgi:hypothetical protein